MKKIVLWLTIFGFNNFFICSEKDVSKIIKPVHCIVVILEAKIGKEALLRNELLKIKELSLKEHACLHYYVHEDTNNPHQFVLYECWENAVEHAKQFQKSYILEFGSKLEDLLEKPYQSITAKILS